MYQSDVHKRVANVFFEYKYSIQFEYNATLLGYMRSSEIKKNIYV